MYTSLSLHKEHSLMIFGSKNHIISKNLNTYILNQEYVLLKNRTVTIKQVSWGKRIDIIIYINDT